MGRMDFRPARREFLWTSLLLPVALKAAQATGEDIEARVARVIAEYDAQGPHRTATEVDDRSASWLVDLARGAGAEASLETFAVDRVDVHAAFVEGEGRRIEGLPLFDGAFTDGGGIHGPLGPAANGAPIVLTEADETGIWSEGRTLAALRQSVDRRAIVVVTRGAQPGLTPINAASFAAPFGVPALQVGSEEGAWLEGLARRRAEIRVVVHAARRPATAANVVAVVHGRQPYRNVVVAMTTRSGWWACAAERGGGLACWLEAIRAVATARAPRTTIFVASSGHEVGHLGLKAFLANRPALVADTTAFVHFGPNIGAADGRPRLQASHGTIEALAAAALRRAGASVAERVPRGTVPSGEARTIHQSGGRYVSLLGSSPYFHSQGDRWPATVDTPAVRRFSQAMADVMVTLASGWRA